MRAILQRTCDDGVQTLGRLNVGDLELKTLELTWKNNERGKSCIPVGVYPVVRHNSPKFKKCFWLKNTEPRQEILIHKGNFHHDIRGCILVGWSYGHLDNDGHVDVISKRIGDLHAFVALLAYDITEIEIVQNF